MKLLSTSNLAIGYSTSGAEKRIQEGMDLSLNPGEIVTVMGQNGVGKTTFIKTITGLLAPLEGSVQIEGTSLEQMDRPTIARKVSVVLTEKPFTLNLTVLELIALGRQPYSDWLGRLNDQDKDVVEKVLSMANINYLVKHRLYELSDGQLQIVMIARALAQETTMIILDEPTAHLDLHNKIEVMALLTKIAQQGKAVLISSHDLQLATQLSDRMWLFHFDKQVVPGLPEDLILSGQLHSALYLNPSNYDMIHGTVKGLQNGSPIRIKGNEKVVFWVRRALERKGYRISGIDGPLIECEGSNRIILRTDDNKYEVSSVEKLLEKVKSLTTIPTPDAS